MAFFLLVSAVAASSILLYVFVRIWSGSVALAVWLCVVNVAALSALCMTVETLRRKAAVDRPVRRILSATERMIAGDYAVCLKPLHARGRYDEFDVVAENLNRLAAELSKTEIIRNDFVANVSHEIKAPLAVIRGYAAALRDKALSEDVRREYAGLLVDECARLTVLVTDILKLNKLENREILPECAPVDLGEQIRECIIAKEELFEQKGLELECEIEDVTVRTDGGLLSLIWNNLLSNAVKFTERGDTVSVSCAEENGKAVVRVRDTGCGISPETGAHIFDKFYQGDTSHACEGNGLGLALVKKVIDIVGGEISVESEVGRGSTFTVRLGETAS